MLTEVGNRLRLIAKVRHGLRPYNSRAHMYPYGIMLITEVINVLRLLAEVRNGLRLIAEVGHRLRLYNSQGQK